MRVLCDTAGVGELYRCLSTGSPFGHHPQLRMVRPRWGRWMHTGKLSFLNLPPHGFTLQASSPGTVGECDKIQ